MNTTTSVTTGDNTPANAPKLQAGQIIKCIQTAHNDGGPDFHSRGVWYEVVGVNEKGFLVYTNIGHKSTFTWATAPKYFDISNPR